MMSVALASRSLRGLSVMFRRPLLLVGLVPSAPMNEATADTSGSCRTTSASARWRSIIRVKDASGAASETPMMRPVSWVGKNPLGMITARRKVRPRVAMVTASVSGWWSSTHFSPRS